MSEDNKKILPKDSDTDYSLPGRLEESNSEYFEVDSSNTKTKSRALLIGIVIFAIISSGFFSYYFINQKEIDPQIIQNTFKIDPEEKLIKKYGIGEFGSDHDHAVIAVFIDDEKINFSLSQFQLSSKYIHFENHNSHLIHKHATDVPLEMLFASFGMKITQNCLILNNDKPTKNELCAEKNESVKIYVNGEKYNDNISQYIVEQDDRILISFGSEELIPKHLKYLESLELFEVPKNTPQYSEIDITV